MFQGFDVGERVERACCISSDDGIDVCMLLASKRVMFKSVIPPPGKFLCNDAAREWEIDLSVVANNPMKGLVCSAPPVSPECSHLEDQVIAFSI